MLKNTLYRFLELTQGSWRNAVYLECTACAFGKTQCGPFLLTTDAGGTPMLYPVEQLQRETGQTVDKTECAAVLSADAFARLFHQWLLWNVTDSGKCCVLQLLEHSPVNQANHP